MVRKFWQKRLKMAAMSSMKQVLPAAFRLFVRLVEGFSSDRITKIMGIVNGTTNYILTKMSQEGAAYADVLKEAQELGYAEADPTSDVEGWMQLVK